MISEYIRLKILHSETVNRKDGERLRSIVFIALRDQCKHEIIFRLENNAMMKNARNRNGHPFVTFTMNPEKNLLTGIFSKP